jgi:hypothetical protein
MQRVEGEASPGQVAQEAHPCAQVGSGRELTTSPTSGAVASAACRPECGLRLRWRRRWWR